MIKKHNNNNNNNNDSHSNDDNYDDNNNHDNSHKPAQCWTNNLHVWKCKFHSSAHKVNTTSGNYVWKPFSRKYNRIRELAVENSHTHNS